MDAAMKAAAVEAVARIAKLAAAKRREKPLQPATGSEAYSTPIQPLDILAEVPPAKKFEWAKRLLAKYGSLVSVLILIGLFISVVAIPSSSRRPPTKRPPMGSLLSKSSKGVGCSQGLPRESRETEVKVKLS